MAHVPMVVRVGFGRAGSVDRVEWGTADTDTNGWAKQPAVTDVVNVVDLILHGTEVWTRLPSGASGPKAKVVPSKAGGGVETIELDDDHRTVHDLARL